MSSIDTYHSCPKKYSYRYIEKPDVPRVKWSFTEFGSCAHRILELFHEYLLDNEVKQDEFPRDK